MAEYVPRSTLSLERSSEKREGGEEGNMKRATKVLVAIFVVVFLSAAPAMATLPLIVGTSAGDQIMGTSNAEEILGLGGSDEISDGLGRDLVYGGMGADNLIGYGGDTSWIASTAGEATTSSSLGTFRPLRTW